MAFLAHSSADRIKSANERAMGFGLIPGNRACCPAM
jgi:hypothetical protein